ncbi:hypothetical protein [Actinokineospora auranticolor]
MAGDEANYGPDHPAVAHSLNNLGVVLQGPGLARTGQTADGASPPHL